MSCRGQSDWGHPQMDDHRPQSVRPSNGPQSNRRGPLPLVNAGMRYRPAWSFSGRVASQGQPRVVGSGLVRKWGSRPPVLSRWVLGGTVYRMWKRILRVGLVGIVLTMVASTLPAFAAPGDIDNFVPTSTYGPHCQQVVSGDWANATVCQTDNGDVYYYMDSSGEIRARAR